MKSAKKELGSSIPEDPANGMLPHGKQATPAFLEKLFDILDEKSPYGHLISWQPDGCSFIIKKVHEFSEVVLPKYFKHSNIQSYIRQLNMYGFSKTRHDSTHREFTHKLFRRGRRDLLPMIKRKSQHNQTTPAPESSVSPAMALADYDLQSLKVTENFPCEDMDSIHSNDASHDNSMRIAHLENKVQLLSSLYYNLAQKHNHLCETLQTLQGHSRGEYEELEVISEEECDDQDRHQGHTTDETSGQSSTVSGRSPSPAVSRSSGDSIGNGSHKEPCPEVLDGNLLAGSAIDNFAGCALRRMPSLNDGYDEPPQLAAEMCSTGEICLPGQPLSRVNTIDSTSTKRTCPVDKGVNTDTSSAKRARANYLEFKTNSAEIETLLSQASRPSPAALKKSYSVEMPGIDAIAVAANMLDFHDQRQRASDEILSGKYLLKKEPNTTYKRAFSYG